MHILTRKEASVGEWGSQGGRQNGRKGRKASLRGEERVIPLLSASAVSKLYPFSLSLSRDAANSGSERRRDFGGGGREGEMRAPGGVEKGHLSVGRVWKGYLFRGKEEFGGKNTRLSGETSSSSYTSSSSSSSSSLANIQHLCSRSRDRFRPFPFGGNDSGIDPDCDGTRQLAHARSDSASPSQSWTQKGEDRRRRRRGERLLPQTMLNA